MAIIDEQRYYDGIDNFRNISYINISYHYERTLICNIIYIYIHAFVFNHKANIS